MASPSPTAVPAERGPAISAMSVCCTPFQPMPKKPNTSASGVRSHAPAAGPVKAMASEQSAEPQPAMTSGARRRPPNVRSESTPKATRPRTPPAWASAR